MNKKVVKKSKKILSEEEEKALILAKADEIAGEQLVIFGEGEGVRLENELKKFALGNIDNPEKKYDLLYRGIMKLLRTYLPKGKTHSKARKYIYEEKNTFLTRGHRKNQYGRRGADSRMAYVGEIEELLDIITKWIVNRGTTAELFEILREINIERGYGEPIILES